MIHFHCHLDLYPYSARGRSCLRGARALCAVGHDNAVSLVGHDGAGQGLERIRTALGLHPQIAHQRKGELSAVRASVRRNALCWRDRAGWCTGV